jgi:hypothetical protein
MLRSRYSVWTHMITVIVSKHRRCTQLFAFIYMYYLVLEMNKINTYWGNLKLSCGIIPCLCLKSYL